MAAVATLVDVVIAPPPVHQLESANVCSYHRVGFKGGIQLKNQQRKTSSIASNATVWSAQVMAVAYSVRSQDGFCLSIIYLL